MKKRIIFLVLICIVTFGLVGCTDNTSKEIKKDNKPSKEKADWEKFPQSNTNYDFSDANNKEITKIFNHLGFYYSNTNDGEEHLWGLTFQNLYNEMKKYIGEISYKTLSSTLKELEADQLVHREEYPQIPPKVEYSLTERCKSLIPILDGMCEGGDKNRL